MGERSRALAKTTRLKTATGKKALASDLNDSPYGYPFLDWVAR